MSTEAYITIDGQVLEERQAMVVRIAMMALADIVANQEHFKQEGVRITDDCVRDIAVVLAMLEGDRFRIQ